MAKHREHRPDDLGPRVFRNHNGDVCLDLRPWGAGRKTARDPDAAGWPRRGRKADSEREADDWKWRYVEWAEAQGGQPSTTVPSAARPGSLDEAAGRFLRERSQVQAANTVSADQTALNSLAWHMASGARVDHITGEVLNAWKKGLMRQGYRPSTVTAYLQSIGVFLRWLGEGKRPAPWQAALIEVAEGITVPGRGEPNPRAFDDDEIRRLRAAAAKLGDAYPLILEAGLSTGARKNELFALRWEDFDPAKRAVRIERQCVNTSSNETRELKSRHSRRTALVLPEWWDHHRPGAKGRIFDLKGERRAKAIDHVYEEAGLNEMGVGYHALRHTYSRVYLEVYGGILQELKRFLGHGSVQVTERYYGHFSEDAALRLGAHAVYGAEISRRRRGLSLAS